MKKLLFALVPFFMLVFFLAAEEKTEEEKKPEADTSEIQKKEEGKKKLEFDKESTLKNEKKTFDFDSSSTLNKGKKSSLEFDAGSTLSGSSLSLSVDTTVKNIKERLQQSPEKAKILQAKAVYVGKLKKEAEATGNPDAVKACADFAGNLKILADFYAGQGQDVPNEKLFKAYNDCQYPEKGISQLKLRIAAARYNAPAAKKIRKFQRAAANYRERAQIAARQGYVAKAEYYNACAELKGQAAAVYAKDPKIEARCNDGMKAARNKYLMNDAKESAVRFRRRAQDARASDDTANAEYYEKVALLKERLYNAYKNNDESAVKSILKEYNEMRSGR
ncbi:MAG: hypothetical protein PHV82_00035 [Victivallaceae bacterium]|nr:hypothetical protein [Victivallaceae bacterium]